MWITSMGDSVKSPKARSWRRFTVDRAQRSNIFTAPHSFQTRNIANKSMQVMNQD